MRMVLENSSCLYGVSVTGDSKKGVTVVGTVADLLWGHVSGITAESNEQLQDYNKIFLIWL